MPAIPRLCIASRGKNYYVKPFHPIPERYRQTDGQNCYINIARQYADFHEILYTAADFELDERPVIKNEKDALDRL